MTSRSLGVLGLVLVLATCACQRTITTLEITTTPVVLQCGNFMISDEMTCLVHKELLLIQTMSETPQQMRLTTDPALQLMLNGTASIQSGIQGFDIAILEGNGVLTSQGVVRPLVAGQQISIAEAGAIGPISHITVQSEAHVIRQLPRPVQLAVTPISPIGTTSPTAISTATGCQTPAEWTATYNVRRGDTLISIARRSGVDTETLRSGNCLADGGLIFIGQVLRLPGTASTLSGIETPTPSAVYFRSDQASVRQGECTILRWDVRNVEMVWLDDVPVETTGEMTICPQEEQTYTLRVSYFDRTESVHITRLSIAE